MKNVERKIASTISVSSIGVNTIEELREAMGYNLALTLKSLFKQDKITSILSLDWKIESNQMGYVLRYLEYSK